MQWVTLVTYSSNGSLIPSSTRDVNIVLGASSMQTFDALCENKCFIKLWHW
jgi:hypothetical protein